MTLIDSSIRRLNRVLFGAADRALALAGPTASPLVSLLHGVFGDRLARNPMRTVMQLRHRGARLKLGRRDLARAFPDASDRLVVFIHGLAADESSWRRDSARAWGRQGLSYGDLLAERGRVTPLYLRYNSGLRVAANGRALADLLRRLVAAFPVAPRSIVLVGHSMGGLVARSACHHGQSRGDAWAGHVTDVVCLGAPHRGAVLEKIGAATVATLAGFGVTAPLARAFDLRSAGIKDLHRGAAHHDEALLPRARYHDLAGTLASPDHLFSWALGDGLVRVASAAPDRPNTRRTILPGVGHLAMLAHPDVLARLAEILGDSSTLH
jgi:pimeloyl-ACP methyl ester carboxylesterase